MWVLRTSNYQRHVHHYRLDLWAATDNGRMSRAWRAMSEREGLTDEACRTLWEQTHSTYQAYRAAYAIGLARGLTEGARRQRHKDAEIARSWETRVWSKNGILEDETTFMCNDVAKNIAEAIERDSMPSHRSGCNNGGPCLTSCMCHCHDEEGMADAE